MIQTSTFIYPIAGNYFMPSKGVRQNWGLPWFLESFCARGVAGSWGEFTEFACGGSHSPPCGGFHSTCHAENQSSLYFPRNGGVLVLLMVDRCLLLICSLWLSRLNFVGFCLVCFLFFANSQGAGLRKIIQSYPPQVGVSPDTLVFLQGGEGTSRSVGCNALFIHSTDPAGERWRQYFIKVS